MNNFNTQGYNLKRGIENFIKRISKEQTVPYLKFIMQMIYGLLCSQNSHLSSIARVLNEKTSVKKIIDRLSRNLHNFRFGETLFSNYVKAVKPQIKDTSILVIDGSDITKPCSKHLEGLCRVRDGSTGEYKDGYHTLGVVALASKTKMPIPIYTRVYTTEEEGFISEGAETLNCFEFLSNHFKKSNIRAMDRGYDNNEYYKYFINNKENFVIRAKKNRDVVYKGCRINILELAKRYKGKYKMSFKNKNGKTAECKISILPVSLPIMPNSELNLVVCNGFGKTPMMLLTSLKSDDNRLAVAITKVYLTRWRIEEFYKFKKQQFKFEDLRVRSLNSIRNLDLLLTIAIGYLGKMSVAQENESTTISIISISKRINKTPKFTYYAIADGLHFILTKCKQGIEHLRKKPSNKHQLSFFPLFSKEFSLCV